MYQFILLIHVFAAIFIVALVLVQQGKGASVGAAFGSGASQTMFGSRGAGSFLFRITLSLVAVFFLTSILLNYLTVHAYKQGTVIELPVLPQKAPQKNTTHETAPAVSKEQENKSGAAVPVQPAEIPVRN